MDFVATRLVLLSLPGLQAGCRPDRKGKQLHSILLLSLSAAYLYSEQRRTNNCAMLKYLWSKLRLSDINVHS